MTAAVGRPQGAILLSSYQELDRFVQAFADGQLNLLFLLGRPGVQKSRIVHAAVGSRAGWIDGSATGPAAIAWRFPAHSRRLLHPS